MATEIEICNGAIGLAGSSKVIHDLTDNTTTARLCNRYLNPARETVLRDHPWNFANKRLALTLSSENSYEWAYVYALPADCMRANEIVKDNRADPKIDFELGVSEDRTQRLLYTDKENAVLIYNTDITNVNLFDSAATDLLTTRLSADICFPLTKSKTLRQQLLTMYQNSLQSAKLIDSAEGKVETPVIPSWIQARTSRNEDR